MNKEDEKTKKTTRNRKPTLVQTFHGLPPIEKAMVEALSAVHTRISKSNFLNCLRKLKIRTPGGKAFAAKTVEPYLDELFDAGLAVPEGYYFKCNPKIVDVVARHLVDQGRFKEFADAVRSIFSLYTDWSGKHFATDYSQLVNEIRMAIYEKESFRTYQLLSEHEGKYRNEIRECHPFLAIFRNNPDIEWISENLPENLVVDILRKLLDEAAAYLSPYGPKVFSLLKTEAEKMGDGESFSPMALQLAWWQILEGKLDDALEWISGRDDLDAQLLNALASFLRGSNDEAIARFDAAHALLKKATRKRKVSFAHPAGLFFAIALIKRGNPEDLHRASTYCAIAKSDGDNFHLQAYELLEQLIKARNADPDAIESIAGCPALPDYHKALSILLQALCSFWTSPRAGSKYADTLGKLHARAQKCGAAWIAAEAAELYSRLVPGANTFAEQASAFRKQSGIVSMVDIVRRETKWERVLNAMIDLKKGPAPVLENKFDKSSRLIWLFRYNEKSGSWDLSPREQSLSAGGVWSKGRKIALKRLFHETDTFDFLTPQDVNICLALREDTSYWQGYPETSYFFDPKTPLHLAGHPLVFWEDSPSTQVEIVKGDPELVVGKTAEGKIEISFPHDLTTENKVKLVKEGPNRIKAIEVNDDLLKIAKLVGKGVKIPESAKDRVLEAIEGASSIATVHSELEGAGRGAAEVQSDPIPNVHLLPLNQGLKVEFFCRPFSNIGPYFRPGHGGETVVTDIGGQTMRARRDLKKERSLAEEALSACPSLLSRQEAPDGDWNWRLPEPEDCLEVLSELRELGDNVTVAWPEGEKFRIRDKADTNRFFVDVKKSRDWFSVSGQLKVEDDLVLDLKRLLELLEESPGRFVRLDDGRFLALTQSFRKRLEEIKSWSEPSGDSRRFHPLAALALRDLADELGGLKGDKDWKKHMEKFEEANAWDPKLPSTFKGDLREYQTEGFKWLARLSRWGAGACLADDMGLGKTIQALAAILENAPNGPSMAVAPTSVLMNWKDEAARFAPTLNVVEFGSGDRQTVLDNLAAFDLLLVSYGLLQQEKTAEMLSSVKFATVVLDEAQAIKNFATKRSKAAMNLQADFKLITTGTPLENHLGELWNLFRFVNPGMLGSLNEFNRKFALPIEKYRDRNARQRLQKLVRPFMLRRTKNQVLEELPARTDIVLRVESSPEQMAFYEALRQKAVENLESSGGDAAGGPKHLRILAEITKLRRACCHPKLVLPETTIGSAKLDAFGELVEELLQNGHKALVFSQFTSHLAILREHLDDRSVSYQYLDGSTTAKERERRVKAFQAGEGDLFLISLKAGGTGLNLTAADFVIHMDPWWNPAVEDQASDRAHRIGQTRPVTVYRLVAKDTVEEKIVRLHREKRDLAQSLLEGADMSGKMSADELLRLIREPVD